MKLRSRDEKYIWGLILVKAGRERVKITTLRGKESKTVMVGSPCMTCGDL